MKNKKALSTIIATTLMVLVSIIAMSVMAVIVMNIVKKPNLAPAFSCTDWQLSAPLYINSACLNQETGDLDITLSRGFELDEIDAITFISSSGNQNLAWQCGGDSCSDCSVLESGTTRKYYFSFNGIERPQRIRMALFGCTFSERDVSVC